MRSLIGGAIDLIAQVNPSLGASLRNDSRLANDLFRERAESFLARFEAVLKSSGRSFEYGIGCFLRLREAMAVERQYFLEHQRYSNSSFAEVAQAVYHNRDVMEYHMYGLAVAQFLWPEQYRRFAFFCETFPAYAAGIANYLEVGGGHALYVAEAASALPAAARIDVLDISATSLELAQGMAPDPRITWRLTDAADFEPDRLYDFITVAEVLEHLENPLAMLRRVRELLSPDGRAYITTPANAPMIDHIYLFRNAGEIRALLAEAGFAIETETSMYAGGAPPRRAEKLCLPLMYAAFVRPSLS